MIFRKKGPKIVISGYYGFDNCGDEAILLAMIHCFRRLRPDVRIIVLSDKPEATQSLYGVKAVDRWNPAKVALALLTCRLFISGGGSLLQDVTSRKSPKYYLMIIWAACILRKKTMIYGQGVGPLVENENRMRAAAIFNKCSEITVRDDDSAELLKRIGVEKDIHVACDPVMALSYEDVQRDEIKEELQDMNLLDDTGRKQKPLLVVAVRCWQDNRHIAPIASLLDTQARFGWDVLLVPAHFPEDMQAIDKISNQMTERLYCLGRRLTAQQFFALTAYADRVFSMRLHGLICAMAVGTPMIGLSYDPKVDAFMEQAGLERYCLPFDGFDWETAEYLLEELEASPLESRLKQEVRRKALQEAAWVMAKKAMALLD